ncbi:MAG: hypothetical protein H7X91_09360 [Burkholderiales bacterium]|nr:hypothetical protein [Burkholderiales bacterium]
MKPKSKPAPDEMRSDYDFSGGVRGKYFHHFMQSSNVVILEPDVATAFPNAEAVNDALRGLMRLAQRSAGLTGRPTGRAKSTARRST